jgi:hypothetical protein
MSPPNDIITKLKECRRLLWTALMCAGYVYPKAPITSEQLALIALAYQIDVARLIAQLIEDDMYAEVFGVLAETETPRPW